MRTLLLFAAVSISAAAVAQPAQNAGPQAAPQAPRTEAVPPQAPATKARVRTEGAVSGVEGGMPTEQQTGIHGDVSAGGGRPTRSFGELEGQGGGRVHDETSSEREAGRGARGSIR